LETLRSKGIDITDDEAKATTIAILLHDIGHGPFSHALESCIVPSIHHEDLSILLMRRLNVEFKGELTLAIEIFEDKYAKKFLHQLVSSQLDMDRMDYLNRDSFYTGVSEGVIGFDRILKMIYVMNDQLVIEEKGIYSVEKFLIARRLMYWQVYFHKTVIAAEQLLLKILKRAKELAINGHPLFASPSFEFLLKNNPSADDFKGDPRFLDAFANIDDHDIYTSIKVWINDTDRVLSLLCSELINRRLYSIEIQKDAINVEQAELREAELVKNWQIAPELVHYFVFTGIINNNAYNPDGGKIFILTKTKGLQDIAVFSDGLNLDALSKTVQKHFICYPKYR
jgi:HD superfamily phosphohydrolase